MKLHEIAVLLPQKGKPSGQGAIQTSSTGKVARNKVEQVDQDIQANH
jgi:hypothetical protein